MCIKPRTGEKMKKIFALLILVGIITIFTFGCIQQPETNQKPIEEIIFTANVTSETNVTNQTIQPTNETTQEIPDKESTCIESKVYSGKCLDNANIEEEICTNGKLEKVVAPCEKEYLCTNAVCKPDPTKCIETDGGENKTVFGKVLFNNTEYVDKCIMGDIIEYYCSNGKVLSTRDNCDVGMHCINGSCTSWAPTCNKKGNTVTVDYHNYHYDIKTDSCNGYYAITKYVCASNGSYEETEVTCASDEWCSTETIKCEKKKCDNGYGNIITKDTSIPDGIYCENSFCADYCLDNITIKEAYCDGKTAKNATVDCPTRYVCTSTLVNKTNTETNVSNAFYAAYCKFVEN